MAAQLIDGKLIGQQVRDEVAAAVAKRLAAGKSKPTLAAVVVGDRVEFADLRAQQGQRPARNWGWDPLRIACRNRRPRTNWRNSSPASMPTRAVNGILVQLPLPSHLNEERVLQLISIEKDVDGFSPINIGRLAQKGREPLFVPCTPYGCIYLLEQAGVKIEGANAVVLGRSNIVGMPAALLLIGQNATVTVCHSKTRDIAGRRAPGGHPDRGDRQDGVRARRLDQARRRHHRRGHQFQARCRPRRAAIDWSATSISMRPRMWPATLPRCPAESVR